MFSNNYSDFNTPSLRNYLKKIYLDSFFILNKKSILNSFALKRIHFVYLHHIFDDEISSFIRFLNFLESFDIPIISFNDAVLSLQDKNFEYGGICFSFDDGFKNCLSAASILNERGYTATFFINGLMLNNSSLSTKYHFCNNVLNCSPVDFLNCDDIDTLLNSGNSIGNHTYYHNRVSEIPHDVFLDDFSRNHDFLSSTFGPVIDFAWGYGTSEDITSYAISAVKDLGYRSCSSAVRGVYLPTSHVDIFNIYRDHYVAGWNFNHSLTLLSRSILNEL